ncbi:MAG: UvrD-helicase domain-containing protein, partial [Waterburya sp.]
MQPSIYQQKVIDWMSDDLDLSDKVVNSVAGSGKSTLLKLVADAITQSNQDLIEQSLVLVFNRKNKDALVAKLTPRWKNSISTVHSAGYKMLRRYLGVRRLE